MCTWLCEQFDWELLPSSQDNDYDLHLVYSTSKVSSDSKYVHLRPEGLLSENGVRDQHSFSWGSFGACACPVMDDPLAGMFYLLCDYDWYASQQRDAHDRVPASAYRVVQQGFGHIPLADRLAQVLAKALYAAAGRTDSPRMQSLPPRSTLDVDSAAAVRGKSPLRQLGVLVRHVQQLNFAGARAVSITLLGKSDPFASWKLIQQLHERLGLELTVFVLLGYGTRLDPGFQQDDPRWKNLFAELAFATELGIHPSYRTSKDARLLQEEIKRFEQFARKAPRVSRQHYLRMQLPDTMRQLQEQGIEQDYSFGWADACGFRLGTARRLRWFNLRANTCSRLLLDPPHAMEATGRHYLQLSPKQFVELCEKLDAECRQSRSGLHLIWHNSSLSALDGWQGWREAYKKILTILSRP